jgi:hypothetical protein
LPRLLGTTLGSLAVTISTAPAHSAVVVQDTVGYWQQEVQYQIRAGLHESSGTLSGHEIITYINGSPDVLTEFYLHLYLNAFRPGSRWADRDSVEGRRRFNDLADPDYAFERISRSSINGVQVTPSYPYAPDSTIVRFDLPSALSPGETIEVVVDWEARPSTVPRRQGRRGRRFDFAQWYPRVVTYDRDGWQDHPLYPAGEFYGEFGRYDVTLDLPVDQIIGATGVPLEGDPGWERAKADPNLVIDYQRDWYSSRRDPPRGTTEEGVGCAGLAVGAGRKCVRFYAEDVHHFAMSLNPDYIYEEGEFNDVAVRVLYTPVDRSTWGNGIAVRRTVEALRWLDDLFGPFPWPQITNVHRIEGGGTEFPMMVMDGSASLSLILHEVGHNYLMGILANNEWKEGFLDEGFSSFQTNWYFEEHFEGVDVYSGLENSILQLDLDGWSEPVSTVSEDFRDFSTYGAMIYSKAQLFYLQLRYIVGHDTMKAILREYYARWKLKHVTEQAFLGVAEEVSGMELDWFFEQWLHDTPLYDYAIGDVTRLERADGTWDTTVEVVRRGQGWMPVEVGERDASGRPVSFGRVSGQQEREMISFRTPRRPGRLMLDPSVRSHDWDFTNNWERGFFDLGARRWRFDTFVQEPSERDRPVVSIAPTFWWNDASDATVGVRLRSNYLNRYNRWTVWLTRGVWDAFSGLDGIEAATLGESVDFYVKYEDPVWLRSPGGSQSLEVWAQEGTTGARVKLGSEHRRSFASPDAHRGVWQAQWIATREMNFLDTDLWQNAGTVEAGRLDEWDLPSGSTHWKIRLDYGSGVAYTRAAEVDGGRYDADLFFRGTGSVSVRKRFGRFTVGARFFAGGYLAQNDPVRQRAIPLNGADPYQSLGNPLVRTQGAPLVSDDVFYHSPGNANVRAYRPDVDGRWILAGNLEFELDAFRKSRGLLRRASVVAFGDGAFVDTLAVPSFGGRFFTPVYDSGAGVRLWFHVGDFTFPLRVEFPFWVTEPFYAHNKKQGINRSEFRWLVSLQPIF